MKTVNVLGTEYIILSGAEAQNSALKDNPNVAGFCEQYSKRIYIDEIDADSMENVDEYKKRLLRHELIHAFFAESGLMDECDFANNEMMIDWIAIQFPKMIKAFKDVKAL